jgi:hypothetical protein
LILHEKINDPDNNIFGLGFASFYHGLTQVPFFGDYYNYILPFLILIVGVLTLLKFHGRVKNITRNIKNRTRDKDLFMSKGNQHPSNAIAFNNNVYYR